jgi:Carboxypeptidase regulatory-like domain/TonB dependent receptor
MSSIYRRIFRFLGPVIFVTWFTITGSAQTFRGAINGEVTDSTGAVLPGVNVVATAVATRVDYATVTSGAGEFLFRDLPLGTYTVTVSVNGFQTVKVDNIPVAAGLTYTLPIRVAPAQTSTTVEVAADQLTLDTTSDNLSVVLPTKVVQDIPQNGRDYTQLLAQSPGYAGYNSLGGGGYASVNGTRPNAVNWQLEGTDNNDIWWNLSAINISGASGIAGSLIPVDAIDQFSFVTSAGAEIGRNPGGTANVSIKSGTNQFHGTAYYYNRNEFFAANSPFAPAGTKKDYLRNANEGFSLGGPIIRDKTFFFTTFEYQGFGLGNVTGATEPSAAYQAEAQSLLAYYGVPANPVSTALLSLWPASALTGPAQPGNYYNTGVARGKSYNFILKLDQHFNDKNNLSLKGYLGQGFEESPLPSTLTPYWSAGPNRNQNFSAIYNTIVSPRLTNQLSVGLNILYVLFKDKDTSFYPVSLGLNTGVTDPSLSGAPNITIENFDPIGPYSGYGRSEFLGQINDAVSYVTGAHQLHFGGEFRRGWLRDLIENDARGSFSFDGSQGPWSYPGSGSSTPCDALATQNLGQYAPGYSPSDNYDPNVLYLADFLAGCVVSSGITEGNQVRDYYVNSFNVFAQDNWQASRKLSLNYGLRYDYTSPMHNGDQNLSVFDPAVSGGLAVAGSNISNIYQQYWKAVSPRFGFAYQPNEKSRLVIRGGIGYYYDTPYLLPFGSIKDNPAGADPVASASVNSFVIVKNKAIFPSLSDALAGQGVIGLNSASSHFRQSATTTYNLNLQKSLGGSFLAQLGYVGTQSRRLTSLEDINQAAQGSAFESPTCAPVYADAGAGNQQCSRPYFSQFPTFASIDEVESNLTSNYNSLQALLRISAWHGLSTQFSYTWSHALDDETGLVPYTPQNSFDPKADYGNSDLDTRNTFIGYAVYDVPGSTHGPQWLSHGWQVNSALNFHGGQPYTVTASTNPSGNGEFNDRANAVPGTNPYAGISHKIVDGVAQWFNPAAFVDPPQGQYGTTRRNAYYNPGFSQTDLSVFKNTKFEKLTVQFRVEMFNLFNHIDLAPVGFPKATDSSGAIYSTIGAYFAEQGIGPGEPFNTQFALKLIF